MFSQFKLLVWISLPVANLSHQPWSSDWFPKMPKYVSLADGFNRAPITVESFGVITLYITPLLQNISRKVFACRTAFIKCEWLMQCILLVIVLRSSFAILSPGWPLLKDSYYNGQKMRDIYYNNSCFCI